LLSLLDLNVPKRYLFDQSFFLELFNVLQQLYDGRSLDNSLESGSSKLSAKDESHIRN
jgi:hypothetical protein